jgi:hypothetical protein
LVRQKRIVRKRMRVSMKRRRKMKLRASRR